MAKRSQVDSAGVDEAAAPATPQYTGAVKTYEHGADRQHIDGTTYALGDRVELPEDYAAALRDGGLVLISV